MHRIQERAASTRRPPTGWTAVFAGCSLGEQRCRRFPERSRRLLTGLLSLCVRDKEALGYPRRSPLPNQPTTSGAPAPGGLLASASRETVTPRVLHRLRARGLVTTSGALPIAPGRPVAAVQLLTPDGLSTSWQSSCSRPSSVRACTQRRAIGTRPTGATGRTALSDFVATSFRSVARSGNRSGHPVVARSDRLLRRA